MLVHAILKGVSDSRPVADLSTASPLRDLVERYNRYANHDDNLPRVLSLTTGGELKTAIGMMDPEIQVALLHKYSEATKTLDEPTVYAEDPVKADERKFRLYVARLMITSFVVLMLIVIGAVIALSVKSGELANEGLISTIMETAAEIVKLILSAK